MFYTVEGYGLCVVKLYNVVLLYIVSFGLILSGSRGAREVEEYG
jgi:hypothetical protein